MTLIFIVSVVSTFTKRLDNQPTTFGMYVYEEHGKKILVSIAILLVMKSKILIVEGQNETVLKKCPYGTRLNPDSGECNSRIGDLCEISFNLCGANTECVDSKCSCRWRYQISFNKIDCLSQEDLLNDKRYRFAPLKSWREKDNPENREIECENHPRFSYKCHQTLDALNSTRTTSSSPYNPWVILSSTIWSLILISALCP